MTDHKTDSAISTPRGEQGAADIVARAIWEARELDLPPRVQRKKWDDMDMATGAVDIVYRQAHFVQAALNSAGYQIVKLKKTVREPFLIED